MSIASRITSIEGHTSDIYDSVELTGVDTTDIDKNLVNVPNTLKEGYIDIINNGTDTLYNNFPKVSGEGTSLTLNNTYQAPMRNNLKGNTSQTGTPTPSSPIPVNVVSGDNEINICGKNLLKLKNGSNVSQGVTITINDNKATFVGTPTRAYVGSVDMPLNLKKGTYTLSSTNGVNSFFLWFKNQSGNVFSSVAIRPNPSTITLNKDTYSIQVGLEGLTVGTACNVETYFQLEKGSSATTYEAYQGNTYNIDLPSGIELCKIGNYQDYIYKDSDKWYLHKEIKKLVLNGSGNYQLSKNTTPYVFTRYVDNYKYVNENILYCNYFTSTSNGTYGSMTDGETHFRYYTDGNFALYFCTADYSNTTDFKTFLASNNLIAYYVLATPTNTEITDTTLINQLEEFYQAQSKNNQTNISQINNDLGFIISASALKKG